MAGRAPLRLVYCRASLIGASAPPAGLSAPKTESSAPPAVAGATLADRGAPEAGVDAHLTGAGASPTCLRRVVDGF